MAFFRRILSGEFRRAVAAEAAGDYAEAARHYALCGEREKVAEMHLLRSERVTGQDEKLDELRDALHWTDKGMPARSRVLAALGRALVKRARDEGVATAKDRATVSQAAAYLDEAGEHKEAGEALELVGDDDGAARAYERGGLVDELEEVLGRERRRRRREIDTRDGFRRYQLAYEGGRRDEALTELAACCAAADDKGDVRRLMDELGRRIIADGTVALRRRSALGGPRLALSGAAEARLGRDPASPLPLRAPGVSRVHAVLRWDGAAFRLRDAGSRAGTWLAGLPLDGEVPLEGTGAVRLGEDCELTFKAEGAVIRLDVSRGLDRGAALVCVAPGTTVALDGPLAATELGVRAGLRFQEGRPLLEAPAGLLLAGVKVLRAAQLIHGDVVEVEGVELEVA